MWGEILAKINQKAKEFPVSFDYYRWLFYWIDLTLKC